MQVEIWIGANQFAVVEDDLTAATFEQSWFFDSATGLMRATVNYQNVFLLDTNGNATATSLASYLATNPPAAGDTWTVAYTDNNGGNFQARTAQFQFLSQDPGDPGIVVTGAAGADQIYGTSGSDDLKGVNGNDIIIARGDNDRLTGGEGADTLTGDAGADVFVYLAPTDSQQTGGQVDVITDFTPGTDRFDFLAIDAKTQAGFAGDQAFVFVPNGAPAADPGVQANSITWYQSDGNTFIQADVTGDTTADMFIQLSGLKVLTTSDFIL